MATGLLLTAALLLWPEPPRPLLNGPARLALWAGCSLFASSWLLFAVARLARHRFFSADDIEGGGLTSGTERAKVLQALLQNTLEQSVLAVIAYGASLALEPDRPALIARCCACFAIGRMLFFIGYERGAVARALGFVLTFYPTVALIVLALPSAWIRLWSAL